MNNELQIFNFRGRDIRTVSINNEPYFVGKDVAEVLGYSNGSRDVNRHVDEEDRLGYRFGTSGQIREMTIINESGLYSLILSSRMPNAKEFKHWVTSEVLPDIRKHGMYMTGERLASTLAEPENLIKILTAYQQEKIEKEQANQKVVQLTTTIKKVKPKIQYHDRVLKSNAQYTTTQIAKMYGLSGRALNQILHEEKFIYFQNGEWLLYSKFQDKGLLESETKISQYGYTYQSNKWTEKGRKAIFTLLKLRRNMYPKKVAARV